MLKRITARFSRGRGSIMEAVGGVLVAVGVGLWSLPAGLVVAGVMLIASAAVIGPRR